MHDFPRQMLCDLVAQFGIRICDEKGRLEGLLRDRCPQYLPAIRLLIHSLNVGIPTELRSTITGQTRDWVCQRLVQHLKTEFHLTEEASRWAVASWAEALDEAKRAELCYKRGLAFYEKGEYGQAIEEFNKAIELDSLITWRVYNYRGNSFFSIGRYEEAASDYEDLIFLRPDHAIPHFNRGLALLRRGDLDSAIDAFTEAIRLDSEDVDYYRHRCEAHKQKGDYDSALKDCNEVIRLAPGFSAFLERGDVRRSLGDLSEAVADYSEAIHLDAANAVAYVKRGDAFTALDDYGKALADYNSAMSLQPDDEELYYKKGVILYKAEDNEQAFEVLSEAIHLDLLNRGKGYYGLDRYEEAIANYLELIQIREAKPDLYNNNVDRAMTIIGRIRYTERTEWRKLRFEAQAIEDYERRPFYMAGVEEVGKNNVVSYSAYYNTISDQLGGFASLLNVNPVGRQVGLRFSRETDPLRKRAMMDSAGDVLAELASKLAAKDPSQYSIEDVQAAKAILDDYLESNGRFSLVKTAQQLNTDVSLQIRIVERNINKCLQIH